MPVSFLTRKTCAIVIGVCHYICIPIQWIAFVCVTVIGVSLFMSQLLVCFCSVTFIWVFDYVCVTVAGGPSFVWQILVTVIGAAMFPSQSLAYLCVSHSYWWTNVCVKIFGRPFCHSYWWCMAISVSQSQVFLCFGNSYSTPQSGSIHNVRHTDV